MKSNNRDLVVAIDPSFSRSGVFLQTCGFDSLPVFDKMYQKGEVNSMFLSISSDVKEHTFLNIYNRGCFIANRLLEILEPFKGYNIKVIMEIPPPNAQFSSGLFALDSLILKAMSSVSKEILLIPPMTINSFTGNKDKSKSYLVKYVEPLIGNKTVGKSKINHDEASAYILFLIGEAYKQGSLKQKIYKYEDLNG